MKWKILHESKGRMRLHLNKPRMSLAEADQLQDYLAALPGVRTAAVYERTCDVVVVYTENRASLVKGLAAFRFDVEALAEVGAVAILSEEENKGKVAYFGGINRAKFRRKVVPGDRLKLECQIIKRKGPVGIGSATASVDGKVAVSAELTFMIG